MLEPIAGARNIRELHERKGELENIFRETPGALPDVLLRKIQ
jgi:hypothetical protein